MKEVIVCGAIRRSYEGWDGEIFTDIDIFIKEGDGFSTNNYHMVTESCLYVEGSDEKGFITSEGRFVDPIEAKTIFMETKGKILDKELIDYKHSLSRGLSTRFREEERIQYYIKRIEYLEEITNRDHLKMEDLYQW